MTTSQHAAPRLMRASNFSDGQALAGVIEDLELSYDLVDGVTNPTNVPDLPYTAAGLTYSVVGNTNPALFVSVAGDSAGVLTLDFAHNASGVAQITIRATDSSGLFVDDTFTVTVLSSQQQMQLLQQQVQSLPGLLEIGNFGRHRRPSSDRSVIRCDPAARPR